MITVWADFETGAYSLPDREVRRVSESFQKEFERKFAFQFGLLPDELDTDKFAVKYQMSAEQWFWCQENYPDAFSTEPETD